MLLLNNLQPHKSASGNNTLCLFKQPLTATEREAAPHSQAQPCLPEGQPTSDYHHSCYKSTFSLCQHCSGDTPEQRLARVSVIVSQLYIKNDLYTQFSKSRASHGPEQATVCCFPYFSRFPELVLAAGGQSVSHCSHQKQVYQVAAAAPSRSLGQFPFIFPIIESISGRIFPKLTHFERFTLCARARAHMYVCV